MTETMNEMSERLGKLQDKWSKNARNATSRTGILDEAKAAYAERAQTYGGPEDAFARIAGHWNWWLGGKLSQPITAYDVAQMMVGFKQARAMNNHAYRDNHVDGAGYFAIAGEIGEREAG